MKIIDKNYCIDKYHRTILINRSLQIGFKPISKCGSQTFNNRHNFKERIDYVDEFKLKYLLCCIRDPKERFLSSIIETLGRIYCKEINGSFFPGCNIPVSKEVFSYLDLENISSPKEYLYSFMKTIERHNFFDEHNLPMTNFLLNSNNELEMNPIIFDIKYLDLISKKIFEQEGIDYYNIPKCLDNKNCRSKNLSKFEKIENVNLNKIKRHSKGLIKNPFAYSKYLERSIFLRFPNSRFIFSKNYDPLKNLIRYYKNFKFSSKRSFLKQFYEDIFLEGEHCKSDLNKFLQKYYSKDIMLHKNFLNWEKKINFEKPFLSLPKLKNLLE